MFFQLYTKLFICLVCVCVLPWLNIHIKIETYSISPRLNKSLLFVSVFVSVTPTSCQAVSPLSSHTDTKGFHVVSFNCKPFASWTLSLRLQCSPVVQAEYTADTKNCFMHCVVYSTLWKELQKRLRHHRTDLIRNPPETLYFWRLFSMMSSLHFLPAAALASLHESLLEAFGFDSVLCLLSLPLLSAPLCPLWFFLLCMMNVIGFALFN